MTTKQKHYWLYALQLQDNNYYVGITSRKDPQSRIREHQNGFYTAQWVRKHKFAGVKEVIDLGTITSTEARQQEDYRTRQYMDKYGYNNVRGGQYTDTEDYLYIPLFKRFLSATVLRIIGTILFLLAVIGYFVLSST